MYKGKENTFTLKLYGLITGRDLFKETCCAGVQEVTSDCG